METQLSGLIVVLSHSDNGKKEIGFCTDRNFQLAISPIISVERNITNKFINKV